ncbi:MAG: hypothetical protein LBP32_07370 [Spirochaetaceae bacterium]|jgi:hypothetical protein|nr:hypothetical protein [Spirochaetaceae bacterium]
MNLRYGVVVLLYFLNVSLWAETARVLIAGNLEVSANNPAGSSVSLSYTDSALIVLSREVRFFRGVELELTAPQNYLAHRGSLAVVIYAELDHIPEPGVADIQGRQISFEPIPNKIQTVYQIPLRAGHGLRATPYVSIPSDIVAPASFPILFRLIPVTKGLSAEVEAMRFRLTVKPILSDEGAVTISPRYPEQLPDKPFTALIDGEMLENPREERLLREGEHQLLIYSDDYRTETRRFVVERGKVVDIVVELRDATPLVLFEAPEDSLIFFDGVLLEDNLKPHPAEPGIHEVKCRISDYSIVKSIEIQKGKTDKVALTVDLNVAENN